MIKELKLQEIEIVSGGGESKDLSNYHEMTWTEIGVRAFQLVAGTILVFLLILHKSPTTKVKTQ